MTPKPLYLYAALLACLSACAGQTNDKTTDDTAADSSGADSTGGTATQASPDSALVTAASSETISFEMARRLYAERSAKIKGAATGWPRNECETDSKTTGSVRLETKGIEAHTNLKVAQLPGFDTTRYKGIRIYPFKQRGANEYLVVYIVSLTLDTAHFADDKATFRIFKGLNVVAWCPDHTHLGTNHSLEAKSAHFLCRPNCEGDEPSLSF
ncbi:hypothetical protein F5984_11770 [Rudanella paleaurantiibacter]|uniref:Lipoprotein n=1 Tax=Rudanella paleaurantiibacter TaxID=2614655 RepID=A0A7J5U1A9_9BACT|nr:hypothetical protein [Rudanella paleaurantiibacter]KAB7731459.1 hypothetical protein F5984_11770 [Rudanella paleaurantiibacter]